MPPPVRPQAASHPPGLLTGHAHQEPDRAQKGDGATATASRQFRVECAGSALPKHKRKVGEGDVVAAFEANRGLLQTRTTEHLLGGVLAPGGTPGAVFHPTR
jgi:hypothetical protein